MQALLKKIFALSLLCYSSFSLAQSNIAIKNDFRFRNESIREEQASPLPEANRFRQRIRWRIAGTAKINAQTDVTIRVATGTTSNADNASTNQDLGDYYTRKSIDLDQAFFAYKLNDFNQILAGKTPIYFTAAGGADLIFDQDLTPEGLVLKHKYSTESGDFIFNAGASWLNERFSATGATDNTDVGLIGAQVGYNMKFDGFNVLFGAAHYNFSNIKGATAPFARGNTLLSGAYANDFKISAFDIEIGGQIKSSPVSIFYQTANNSEGGNYKNAGIVGIKLGKLKDLYSWTLAIDQREIEKDALVGMLTDSDSSGGGADIRSNRLTFNYQAAENAVVGLILFSGQKTISSKTFSPNYSRTMLDFVFNF